MDASPSKNGDGEAGGIKDFTAGEMRYLTAYFSFMRRKPDVDYQGLADALGFKSAKVAADRGSKILRKHGLLTGQQASLASGSVSSTPHKRAGKAAATAADGPIPDAMTKVTKTRTPRKKKVKKEEDADVEVEAIVPTTPVLGDGTDAEDTPEKQEARGADYLQAVMDGIINNKDDTQQESSTM